MKNIKLTYLLLLAIFVGFSSCKNDDEEVNPEPLPIAQFVQNKQITEAYEMVSFVNTSENATHYEWDFGKGITSTQESPQITFYDPGTYTVKLTAYNSANKASVASGTLVVGRKYITKITLERIDSVSQGGYPWDPQDGPDLYMRIGSANNSNWVYTPVKYNVSKSDFPVSWDFSPSVLVGATETWWFLVYDEDLPYPREFSQDVLGALIQTHSPSYVTKTDGGTKGYISYNEINGKMKVYFDVK